MLLLSIQDKRDESKAAVVNYVAEFAYLKEYSNGMNIQRSTTIAHNRSWFNAYVAFLLSKDENLFLKVAPILIIAGSPELVLSNIIPVVGELADVGGIGLISIVAFKTFRAVKKYR